MKVQCIACGEVFASDEHGHSHSFDEHDCPMTPEPRDFESWDDYQARCEAYRRQHGNTLLSQGRVSKGQR